MYRITKSQHIHFAHHVRGHRGACISLHGHTWRFDVEVGAATLDAEGFVIDFAVMKREVLQPCHRLLDSTNEEVQKVAFRAMFAPIRSQLKAVETVDWEGRGGAGRPLPPCRPACGSRGAAPS